MITNRQTFKYMGKTLIERATITTPFLLERAFPNDGCFLYFKNGKTNIKATSDNVDLGGSEAILLKCGTYFLDFIKTSKIESTEVIAVHLYPEILKKIYPQELPKIIEKKATEKKNPVLHSSEITAKFIESLEFYFDNPSLVNNDLLELKIKELILLLLQTKSVDSILELMQSLYCTKTTDLKAVIDLHKYSNLSIDALAKLCSLSTSSFKRKFKEEYNDTPKRYITSQKMLKAEKLLGISKLAVSEIAFESGFNDPLYFARAFKKKNGCSPTDYRDKT